MWRPSWWLGTSGTSRPTLPKCKRYARRYSRPRNGCTPSFRAYAFIARNRHTGSARLALTGIVATGVGISVAIADIQPGALTDASRRLLVCGFGLAVAGVAALETTLTRAVDEPTHARLSPGLKFGVAAVVVALGLLDLGWSTPALLALLLAGLAVPMTYGAIVWYGRPATTSSTTRA